ncbi:MAG: hypothetical protein LBB88_09385 [Planctomycetaceae bacterium]|nr:hypothetical protein [Planctomycetaceae bacterium]
MSNVENQLNDLLLASCFFVTKIPTHYVESKVRRILPIKISLSIGDKSDKKIL